MVGCPPSGTAGHCTKVHCSREGLVFQLFFKTSKMDEGCIGVHPPVISCLRKNNFTFQTFYSPFLTFISRVTKYNAKWFELMQTVGVYCAEGSFDY